MKRLRRIIQASVLLVFLYSLIALSQRGAPLPFHDLFFKLDPLISLTTLQRISYTTWMSLISLSSLTIFLTIIVGRAWCSWLCPLGTILDWVPSRTQRKVAFRSPWRHLKYLLLFMILFAAILGNLTLLILDPITFFYRSLASGVLPGLRSVVKTVEVGLYQIEVLQRGVEWFDQHILPSILPGQSFFRPNTLLIISLGVVLTLNTVTRRFWCTYICPLGALLGLISRIAIITRKVNQTSCTKCQRCSEICPTKAIDTENKFLSSSSECTMCLDCKQVCPSHAITFKNLSASETKSNYDPQRRKLLTSLTLGVIGAVLLTLISNVRPPQRFIRPPGTSEEQLLRQCIRCGACINVCPTGVLQPSSSPTQWKGVWAPLLETRLSYCDYSCNSCGQVCPTKAIPNLPLNEKQNTVIGIARIDTLRCLSWAEGRHCIVCEEMCPIPQKAIRLEEAELTDGSDDVTLILRPRVIPNLCIGCGICEHKCPVDGQAAIKVY